MSFGVRKSDTASTVDMFLKGTTVCLLQGNGDSIGKGKVRVPNGSVGEAGAGRWRSGGAGPGRCSVPSDRL